MTRPGSIAADDPRRDDDERLRLADLRAFARMARRAAVRTARTADSPTLTELLRRHLGSGVEDVEDMAVIEESWPAFELVNVQLAVDRWLSEPARSHELVGIVDVYMQGVRLADLLRPGSPRHQPRPGNVSYLTLASGPDGQVTRAVSQGLYLVAQEAEGADPASDRTGPERAWRRAAILLFAGDPDEGFGGVSLHVVADAPGAAAAIATGIRDLAVRLNVYRGQVLSFGGDYFERGSALRFHPRPTLSAAEVILPGEVLAAIDRQAVGVARHRERLLAAGQHLKRGLLLYGPPGVGKTHTLRYLIGRLHGVTVLQLTGESLHAVSQACSIARALQPAMVVVEDVDLIAEDRDLYDDEGGQSTLFELLNAMDGLAEDADVVFVLTTNRPEALETALAARPGRVDQAVELRLPDTQARRRLFDLYKGRLDVEDSGLDRVIERTEGVTASFLKELLRRAALLAAAAEADRSPGAAVHLAERGPLRVSAEHLDEALAELLDTRNAMTRLLLGARRRGATSAGRGRRRDDEDSYDANQDDDDEDDEG